MSQVNIADIRVNGGTQSRAGINRETVAEYAEAMQGGAVFPPLVVFHDGASYWLADGFHRYHAYAQINAHDVPADVRQGSQRDAILFSVGANASHGLRRTNDDKRRAVMVLLNDPEWSKWSARDIGRQCGVSHDFAARLKREVSSDDSEPRTYTTKHGTEATMNTANIGGGSRADQEAEPLQKKGETPAPKPELPPASKDDQKTDPETAKIMRELAKMTPEGVAGEVAGLRAVAAERKAEIADLKREIADLKDENKALRESEGGRSLGNALRQARAAEGRMREHQASAARLQRQVNAQKAEIANLNKKLENQVIQL